MEPPVKRQRLEESPQDWEDSDLERLEDDEWEECDGEEDVEKASREFKKMFEDKDIGHQLAIQKAHSESRFQATMAHIFDKYGRDFEGIGDEVDLATGEIVVDNGHIENMRNEFDVGDPSDDNDLEQEYDEHAMHVEDLLDDDVRPDQSGNRQRGDDTWPVDTLRQGHEYLEYDSEQGVVMPVHAPSLLSGLYNGGDLRYSSSVGGFGASPFALGPWDMLPQARERCEFPATDGSESIWAPDYQDQDDESDQPLSMQEPSTSKGPKKHPGKAYAKVANSNSNLLRHRGAAMANWPTSALRKVQGVDDYGAAENSLLSPPELGVSSETGDWTEELPEPESANTSVARGKVIPDSQDTSDSQADTEKSFSQPHRPEQPPRKPDRRDFDYASLLSDDESPVYSQLGVPNKRHDYDTDLTDTTESNVRVPANASVSSIVRNTERVELKRKRGRPRKDEIYSAHQRQPQVKRQPQPQPQSQPQLHPQPRADQAINTMEASQQRGTDHQSLTGTKAAAVTPPPPPTLRDDLLQDDRAISAMDSVATSSSALGIVLPDGTVFKRKRGRPRKYALPGKPADPLATQSVPKPTPKLPREHFQQFIKRVQSLQKPDELLKRRRGRPRKTPVKFDKVFPGYLNGVAQSKSKKDGVSEEAWYRLATLLAEDIAYLPGRLGMSKEVVGHEEEASASEAQQRHQSSTESEQQSPNVDQLQNSSNPSEDEAYDIEDIYGNDEGYEDDRDFGIDEVYEDGLLQHPPPSMSKVSGLDKPDVQTSPQHESDPAFNPHPHEDDSAEGPHPIINDAIGEDAVYLAPMSPIEHQDSYLASNIDQECGINPSYPIPSSPCNQQAMVVAQTELRTPDKLGETDYLAPAPLVAWICDTPTSVAFSDSLVDPALKAFDDYSPAPVKLLPDENVNAASEPIQPEQSSQPIAAIIEAPATATDEDGAEDAAFSQTGDQSKQLRDESVMLSAEEQRCDASHVTINESTYWPIGQAAVQCVEQLTEDLSKELDTATTEKAHGHQTEQPVLKQKSNPPQELQNERDALALEAGIEAAAECSKDTPQIQEGIQLSTDLETKTAAVVLELETGAGYQESLESLDVIDESKAEVPSQALMSSPRSIKTTPLKQAGTGIPILLKTPRNLSPPQAAEIGPADPSTPTPKESKRPTEHRLPNDEVPRRPSVTNRYKSVTSKAIPTWNLPSVIKPSASSELPKSDIELNRQSRPQSPQEKERSPKATKRPAGPRRSLLSLFSAKGKSRSYGHDDDDDDDELSGISGSVKMPKTSSVKAPRSFSGSKLGRDSGHKKSTLTSHRVTNIHRTQAPKRRGSTTTSRVVAAATSSEIGKVCGVDGYRCDRDFCFTCLE